MTSALVLADAHCLPFEDQSFDFVLSIAVLEHVRYPLVFMREVARVLRPGGTFVGTVAFLEPFHGRSYYHHTHLGLIDGLANAPLERMALGPVRKWPALRALGEMALFPPLPAPLTRALVSPIQAMHRLVVGSGRRPPAAGYGRPPANVDSGSVRVRGEEGGQNRKTPAPPDARGAGYLLQGWVTSAPGRATRRQAFPRRVSALGGWRTMAFVMKTAARPRWPPSTHQLPARIM